MTSILMNRRAQVGKLISIFPIMILIFIIMGVFILLSSAYSRTNSPDPIKVEPVVITSAAKGDLLERQVASGEGQESVKEAVIKFGNSYKFGDPNEGINKGSFNALKNELSALLINDRIDIGKGLAIDCVAIYGKIGARSSSEGKNLFYVPDRSEVRGDGVFTLLLIKTGLGIEDSVHYARRVKDRGEIEKQMASSHIELPLNDPQYTLNVYYYFGRCEFD